MTTPLADLTRWLERKWGFFVVKCYVRKLLPATKKTLNIPLLKGFVYHGGLRDITLHVKRDPIKRRGAAFAKRKNPPGREGATVGTQTTGRGRTFRRLWGDVTQNAGGTRPL